MDAEVKRGDPADQTTREENAMRECADCGHKGVDDSSSTEAWCSSCLETVPYPVEDVCPSCHHEGSMNAACPACGGRYPLDFDDPTQTTGKPDRSAEPLTTEEEAALRPRHAPYETGFFGGNPPDLACRQCSRPWPCDGSRLLVTLDAARDQAATEARRGLDVDVLTEAYRNVEGKPVTLGADDDEALDEAEWMARVIAAEYRRLIESSPSTEEPTDG